MKIKDKRYYTHSKRCSTSSSFDFLLPSCTLVRPRPCTDICDSICRCCIDVRLYFVHSRSSTPDVPDVPTLYRLQDQKCNQQRAAGRSSSREQAAGQGQKIHPPPTICTIVARAPAPAPRAGFIDGMDKRSVRCTADVYVTMHLMYQACTGRNDVRPCRPNRAADGSTIKMLAIRLPTTPARYIDYIDKMYVRLRPVDRDPDIRHVRSRARRVMYAPPHTTASDICTILIQQKDRAYIKDVIQISVVHDHRLHAMTSHTQA